MSGIILKIQNSNFNVDILFTHSDVTVWFLNVTLLIFLQRRSFTQVLFKILKLFF